MNESKELLEATIKGLEEKLHERKTKIIFEERSAKLKL